MEDNRRAESRAIGQVVRQSLPPLESKDDKRVSSFQKRVRPRNGCAVCANLVQALLNAVWLAGQALAVLRESEDIEVEAK